MYPLILARRGPLIVEALDMAGVYGDQQYAVQCQPDQGGCGFAASFRWKRGAGRNRGAAWGTFKQHARRCPSVPPPYRSDRYYRWRPLRRLAAVVAVLALAALAFAFSVANVTGHATPAPPAPSIAVVPTTTPAPTLAPGEYIPTPAGPPASSPAGGGR